MQPRPTTFETTEFAIAASIMVVTGMQPQMIMKDRETLAVISFPETPELLGAVVAYSAGRLELNVKSYEKCRALLYRKAKEVRYGY
jgi:hypothetical protein